MLMIRTTQKEFHQKGMGGLKGFSNKGSELPLKRVRTSTPNV
jgi:hypothetical protein